MTLLDLVNNVLRLIGEQPLINTQGNLGTLTKQALQSSVFTVVSQTRHSSFLLSEKFAVAETDRLLPAMALPARCIQISNLFYLVNKNTTEPYLFKLEPMRREQFRRRHSGYAVVGSNVYLNLYAERPLTLELEYYKAPDIETLADTDVVDIALEVTKVIETTTAAALAVAYLDDLAQQNSFQKLSQFEVEQLRRRSGALRAPVAWR